jgi:rod shape-determining protein MreD
MTFYIRIIFRFILLVIIQVLVLDNINFGGYINPYLYVLFILMLPYETPGWLLLFSSFALGYSVDIFTNTPGMHAAATVFMAFCRPAILKLFKQKQDYEPGTYPSLHFMGFQVFFLYALMMVLIHHTALFFLEIFRLNEIILTLMRAGFSSIFTLLLIIIVQYLFYSKH